MSSIAKTFLIVSLPDVQNEDVRRLEIEYTTVKRVLTKTDRLFVTLCTEKPYWASDDCRNGGSELALALYLLCKQSRPIIWKSHVLVEAIPDDGDETFSLYDIDTLDKLRRWWRADLVPKHDVCLVAQRVHESRAFGDETLSDHVQTLQNAIREKTGGGKNKRVHLSDIERQILYLDPDHLYEESDSSSSESDCGDSSDSTAEPSDPAKSRRCAPAT